MAIGRKSQEHWGTVTGRHRKPRPSLGIVAGVVVVVIIAAVAGWGGYRFISQQSCGTRVTVSIAAAPEITSVVQTAADQWATGKTAATCASVLVSPVESADVAAAVASQRGATLTGLGQPNGKARVPDVWIADSSTWLQRVRTAATDLLPADAP